MSDTDIYQPLHPKARTIRLIDLQPGKWSAELECELRVTTLARARNRYITVSYSWGNIDTTRQRLIKVNNKQVPVSDNLYTILRRLRQPDLPVLVWADALSINQDNAAERTHQVGFMGEIYKNSSETVIWLGEAGLDDDVGERFLGQCISEEDTVGMRLGGAPRLVWQDEAAHDQKLLDTYLADYNLRWDSARNGVDMQEHAGDANLPFHDIFGAFCLIYSLAQGNSSTEIPFVEGSDYKVMENVSFLRHMRRGREESMQFRSSRTTRVWAGLDKLIKAPWWRRIWVVQETVLAKKATVQFGMVSAPWSMFATAAAHYHHEHHALCLDLAGTLTDQKLLNQFSNSVLRIEDTRIEHRSNANTTTLLSLLWKFRSLEASDKRDKVYALIGLTTNWGGVAPMVPDYRYDEAHMFTRTTLDLIQRSRSLTVLAGDLDPGLGRKRVSKLPSWVLDWSLPSIQLETERLSSMHAYNASGGRRLGAVRFHQRSSLLEAEGIFVDTVIAVGELSMHTQISDTMSVIRKWKILSRRLGPDVTAYSADCSVGDAFWRTLLADVVHTGHVAEAEKAFGTGLYRRTTQDDFVASEAWRMWARCISRDTWGRAATFTQRDLDEGISSVHYALKAATASRRFFITRSGYMGIGPRNIRASDFVYVLKGSSVPFIIRQESSRHCFGKMCFTLVKGEGGKKATTECNQAHNCHKLVGDCYVHGMMDGEAFSRGQGEEDVKPVFLV